MLGGAAMAAGVMVRVVPCPSARDGRAGLCRGGLFALFSWAATTAEWQVPPEAASGARATWHAPGRERAAVRMLFASNKSVWWVPPCERPNSLSSLGRIMCVSL
mmetsp:Transcript_47755/g.126648  ORF Transcript_47755/g.126648 Transcript_47755/m.126648 type:complete len:104 (+) Transcript_47755:350-661(+)